MRDITRLAVMAAAAGGLAVVLATANAASAAPRPMPASFAPGHQGGVPVGNEHVTLKYACTEAGGDTVWNWVALGDASPYAVLSFYAFPTYVPVLAETDYVSAPLLQGSFIDTYAGNVGVSWEPPDSNGVHWVHAPLPDPQVPCA